MNYQCFCFFGMFIFLRGFSAYMIIRSSGEADKYRTLSSQKNDGIFHIFDQFQDYCCESGIAIFAWRVALEITVPLSFKFDPNWWVLSKWLNSFKIRFNSKKKLYAYFSLNWSLVLRLFFSELLNLLSQQADTCKMFAHPQLPTVSLIFIIW